MKNDAIDQLAPDVAALLAAERRAPGPPSFRRARILADLEAAIGAAGAPGSATPAAGQTALALPSKLLLVASMAAALGFGGAVGLSRRRSERAAVPASPPAETAALDAARLPPSPRAEPAGPGVPMSAVVPAATVRTSPRRHRPPTAAHDGPPEPALDVADLRAEAAALERARRVLAAGDATTALATLAGAERTFPHGLLIEEREALTIRALAAAGQGAAARARAVAFTRRYPASIQADAISEALDGDVD